VFNGRATVPMRVAGTTTLPAIGIGHGIHPSLGRGAFLAAADLPVAFLDGGAGHPAMSGPNTILVRFRPGVDQAAADRRLDRISAQLSQVRPDLGVQSLPVQRPAEIVNYRTMGGAPLILSALLAAGAAVSLAITLATAARRRFRDFALLRTLGFVRQVVTAVIWQARCAWPSARDQVPLGITVRRFLWNRFATELYVVPHPALPAAAIAAVGLGALVLAVLTALVPGWLVARASSAEALRRSALDVV
jgi:hypothetical protein